MECGNKLRKAQKEQLPQLFCLFGTPLNLSLKLFWAYLARKFNGHCVQGRFQKSITGRA